MDPKSSVLLSVCWHKDGVCLLAQGHCLPACQNWPPCVIPHIWPLVKPPPTCLCLVPHAIAVLVHGHAAAVALEQVAALTLSLL